MFSFLILQTACLFPDQLKYKINTLPKSQAEYTKGYKPLQRASAHTPAELPLSPGVPKVETGPLASVLNTGSTWLKRLVCLHPWLAGEAQEVGAETSQLQVPELGGR